MDKGPVTLTLVAPMVVEISADVAWTGNAFRHAIKYLRPRPELSPADTSSRHLDGETLTLSRSASPSSFVGATSLRSKNPLLPLLATEVQKGLQRLP